MRLPKEEDHQYAPCPEKKPHPKYAWQSFENPFFNDYIW